MEDCCKVSSAPKSFSQFGSKTNSLLRPKILSNLGGSKPFSFSFNESTKSNKLSVNCTASDSKVQDFSVSHQFLDLLPGGDVKVGICNQNRLSISGSYRNEAALKGLKLSFSASDLALSQQPMTLSSLKDSGSYLSQCKMSISCSKDGIPGSSLPKDAAFEASLSSDNLKEGKIKASSSAVVYQGAWSHGLKGSLDLHKMRTSLSYCAYNANNCTSYFVDCNDASSPKKLQLGVASCQKNLKLGALVKTSPDASPDITLAMEKKLDNVKLLMQTTSDRSFAVALEVPLNQQVTIGVGQRHTFKEEMSFKSLAQNTALSLSVSF